MTTATRVPHGRMTQVLGSIPNGADHPRTVASISEATGISARDIHRIVRSLVIQYGVPIGGVRTDGRHGLFIITSEAERTAAVVPLQNNAREIEHRITKLQEITL